ncbi:hypothetical protein N1851_000067 [Merluccius polli]|uniref:Myb/SANT-like DNA-binding domain-containing protein n=1 Tax=Merluccius polli TaxID=89951 RepID=A0AA47NDP0_MERPO|nr:hypothetical protein N1851_000067 [Merluccius polli]
MTTDRKRATYFTALELEVLMMAYADYEHIFRRKSNTAAAAKEREAAWEKIAASVTLKKAEARKTGGGPPPPPLTEAEKLALSQNRGRPAAEGIPGGSSSESVTPQDTSGYIRCKYTLMSLKKIKLIYKYIAYFLTHISTHPTVEDGVICLQPPTETVNPAAVSIPYSDLASDGSSKYSETESFSASQEEEEDDDEETVCCHRERSGGAYRSVS